MEDDQQNKVDDNGDTELLRIIKDTYAYTSMLLNDNGFEVGGSNMLQETEVGGSNSSNGFGPVDELRTLFSKSSKLSSKLDVNVLDKYGNSALHYAVRFGYLGCVKLLLENKANIEVRNKYGLTPLLLSLDAAQLNIDLPQLLTIEKESERMESHNKIVSDDIVQNKTVKTELEERNFEVIKLLLDKSGDVNAKDNLGRNALMYFIFHHATLGGEHRLENKSYTLKNEFYTAENINSKDEHGGSALTYAISKGVNDITKKLLNSPFLLKEVSQLDELKNSQGLRPLEMALRLRQNEIFQLLVNSGCLVSQIKVGEYTLHDSIHICRWDLAERCVRDNIEVINSTDPDGKLPAYLATISHEESRGHDFLKLLIKNGAIYESLNCTRHRLTPQEKHQRTIEFLLVGLIFVISASAVFGTSSKTGFCETFLNNAILPSYLFDFISPFIFKIAEYVFVEQIFQGLDFLYFAASFRSSSDADNADNSKVKNTEIKNEFTPCENPMIDGNQNHKELGETLRVSLTTQSRDLVLPEDAINRSTLWERSTTFKTHHNSRCSLAVDAVDSTNRRIELPVVDTTANVDTQQPITGKSAAQHIGINIVSDVSNKAEMSRHESYVEKLSGLFGQDTLEAWRLKKFEKAKKSAIDYTEGLFWLQPVYIFLYLQVILAYVAIIVASSTYSASASSFENYTNFYAIIAYSGVPTAAFSYLKFARKRWKQFFELPPIVNLALVVPVCVLIPTFYSHTIPMSFFYSWVSCVVVCGLLCSYLLYHIIPLTLGYDSQNLIEYRSELFGELFLRILWQYSFRVLFTWGVIAYPILNRLVELNRINNPDNNPNIPLIVINGNEYLGIIATDFRLRSQTQCFFENSFKTASGTMSAWSWF